MGSVADSVVANIRTIIENTDFSARETTQKWISLAYSYLIMLNQALKSYFTSQTKWFQGKSITNITKHLRISAKVLYYYIMPKRDIISQSLF